MGRNQVAVINASLAPPSLHRPCPLLHVTLTPPTRRFARPLQHAGLPAFLSRDLPSGVGQQGNWYGVPAGGLSPVGVSWPVSEVLVCSGGRASSCRSRGQTRERAGSCTPAGSGPLGRWGVGAGQRPAACGAAARRRAEGPCGAAAHGPGACVSDACGRSSGDSTPICLSPALPSPSIGPEPWST